MELPCYYLISVIWSYVAMATTVAHHLRSDKTRTIDYYENLILTEMNNSIYYNPPTSAEFYRPKNDQVEDFGTYDFIVVGAGTAGSVVANRLSEVKKWKVLLLETGGPESDFSVIPAMNLYLINSKFNWNYYTTKQSNACLAIIDGTCPMPRGRALGGTTAINGIVYSRGNKNNYNRWAAQGNNGWSYKDVLPYFIKSENSEIIGDPGYHGRGGYWNVEYYRPEISNHIMASFIEGSNIISYSPSIDYNGREEIGAFYSQVNKNKQYRQSTSKAFLEPIMNRPNLKILTYSYVTKVVIDNLTKIAKGVTFTRNGTTYLASARKEVILSAGSINSPQILMLSGIGPEQHLQQMQIPVIKNLPSTGHNLQDHIVFLGAFISTNSTSPPLTLREQIKQFLDGYGPLTRALDSQGFIFSQSENETTSDLPNYQVEVKPDMGSNTYLPLALKRIVKPEVLDTLFKEMDFNTSVGAFLYVFQPRSVGNVTLLSNNPFVYPKIDISYLDNQRDIDIMYDGIKMLEKLVKTEPLQKINASLVHFDYPECSDKKMGTKDYWVCAFRLLTISGNNPTGTCRMGPDANTSVVDNRGKVYGISGLRVADASITPFPLTGHQAAGTVMIGEKISDYIKLDHGLKIYPITNVIL